MTCYYQEAYATLLSSWHSFVFLILSDDLIKDINVDVFHLKLQLLTFKVIDQVDFWGYSVKAGEENIKYSVFFPIMVFGMFSLKLVACYLLKAVLDRCEVI